MPARSRPAVPAPGASWRGAGLTATGSVSAGTAAAAAMAAENAGGMTGTPADARWSGHQYRVAARARTAGVPSGSGTCGGEAKGAWTALLRGAVTGIMGGGAGAAAAANPASAVEAAAAAGTAAGPTAGLATGAVTLGTAGTAALTETVAKSARTGQLTESIRIWRTERSAENGTNVESSADARRKQNRRNAASDESVRAVGTPAPMPGCAAWTVRRSAVQSTPPARRTSAKGAVRRQLPAVIRLPTSLAKPAIVPSQQPHQTR